MEYSPAFLISNFKQVGKDGMDKKTVFKQKPKSYKIRHINLTRYAPELNVGEEGVKCSREMWEGDRIKR